MTGLQVVAVALASAAAGAVNAVAGGGTLITYPVLVGIGLGPVTANATSTVGLVPGSLGGALGYRRELSEVRSHLAWLALPSIVGGALGAGLLLLTPPLLFARLVPMLILGATVLFLFQDPIRRVLLRDRQGSPWAVASGQLVIATYGGYFGAGIGILMLATLGLLNLGSIHRANALKTISAVLINLVAALLFVVAGSVRWAEALVMIVASMAGGYLAAGRARRLGQGTIRGMVVATGLAAAIYTAARAFS